MLIYTQLINFFGHLQGFVEMLKIISFIINHNLHQPETDTGQFKHIFFCQRFSLIKGFLGFLMVLIASVERISQYLFRTKTPFMCRFQGGNQSMDIAFVSGFDFNMGDQVQGSLALLFILRITVGFHHLNLVSLALVR